MHRAIRAVGLVLAPVLVVLAAAAPAVASGAGHHGRPGNPIIHVRPLVISQVCDEAANPTHGQHCVQGSFSNAITLQAPNGQPNQEFNFFTPGPGDTACNNDVTTTNCPFPGVTPGEQIVVLGGQDSQNAGHCLGFTSLRTAPSWTPCNGGTGDIAVLDGRAVEYALLGRQQGGKVYMCENPLNTDTIRTVFTPGDCQWSNQAQ